MRGIARALQIFELVATSGPIGVSDIARRVDLPKSTVQRHLLSLDEAAWIRPIGESDSTKWVATPRALTLSRRGSTEGTIAATARDFMIKLRDEIGETVYLQVPMINFQIVNIERVDSLQPVLATIELGAANHFALTAGGLAILAHLPDSVVDEALSQDIPRLTDEAVVDPQAIRDYLPQVKSQGYAVSRGQLRPGVRSIGAAVVNASGSPIAAIGVSFPRERFLEEMVPRWGAAARAAADEISNEI